MPIKKIVITGLVNNAGVRFRKDFITISKKDLKKVMDTNFLSIFFIMQEFSKHILKNKKRCYCKHWFNSRTIWI